MIKGGVGGVYNKIAINQQLFYYCIRMIRGVMMCNVIIVLGCDGLVV